MQRPAALDDAALRRGRATVIKGRSCRFFAMAFVAAHAPSGHTCVERNMRAKQQVCLRERQLMDDKHNQHLGPMARLLTRFAAQPGIRPMTFDARVERWKASLPPTLSVTALERFAPEALGQIARVWSDRLAIDLLFNTLLYQDKLTPRTYCFEVLAELIALRQHALFVVHRAPQSVWDEVYTFGH
jgi:hypothetical protein